VPLEYWLDRIARNGRTAIYAGIGRCTSEVRCLRRRPERWRRVSGSRGLARRDHCDSRRQHPSLVACTTVTTPFACAPDWEAFAVKKAVSALIGGTLLLIGLALLVLPCPGLLIVAVGLGILASEFLWARRMLRHAKGAVARVRRKSGVRAWLRGRGDAAASPRRP